jgi:hypothetical protein
MNAPLPTPSDDGAPAVAARLFGLLWTGLTDVLGSATTAALLRRSAKALQARRPQATPLKISRVGLAYTYELPPEWRRETPGALASLRDLVDELRPILMELTGEVVLRGLDRIDAFKAEGIRFLEGTR